MAWRECVNARIRNMEKVHMVRAFDGHNDIITGIAVDPFIHTRFASASYDRTYAVSLSIHRLIVDSA